MVPRGMAFVAAMIGRQVGWREEGFCKSRGKSGAVERPGACCRKRTLVPAQTAPHALGAPIASDSLGMAEHVSEPLTEFEYCHLVGVRALQLSQGALQHVPVVEGEGAAETAAREARGGHLGHMIIRRTLPDGSHVDLDAGESATAYCTRRHILFG